MTGRRPKLTYPQLRQIDHWYAMRRLPAKTLAARLGCSKQTIYDALKRRGGYRDCKP
jgi:IS30 family transposase